MCIDYIFYYILLLYIIIYYKMIICILIGMIKGGIYVHLCAFMCFYLY